MGNTLPPSVDAELAKNFTEVITNKAEYAKYKLKSLYVIAGILLAILLGRIVWFSFAPIKPEASKEREQAAKVCADEICETLYKDYGGTYRSITCIPFNGDRTDSVYLAIKNRIASSGAFDVCPVSGYNRIRRRAHLSFAPSNDAETVLKRAKKDKSEAVLCGSVRRFKELEGGGVDLVVDYRLIDITRGDEAFKATYDSKKALETTEEEDVSRAQEATTTTVKEIVYDSSERFETLKKAFPKKRSWLLAVCVWALTTAALPLLTFPLLVWMVQHVRIGVSIAWLVFVAVDLYVWYALKSPSLTWNYVVTTAAIALLTVNYNVETFSLAFLQRGKQ